MGMPAMRHRWTAAQARILIASSPGHWPRYELIDGELIVTPAPATVHQIAVTEIWAVLAPYVERENLGIALVSPADLELRVGHITQPDVFVAPLGTSAPPDYTPSWADVKTLLLAVEIISPGSGRTDRVVKRDYYMNAGVPEYWVVDLDGRVVEQWNPDRETPLVVRSVLDWYPPGAMERLSIDVHALFERIWDKCRRLGGRLADH
jgi:Uma2 family endonuclease